MGSEPYLGLRSLNCGQNPQRESTPKLIVLGSSRSGVLKCGLVVVSECRYLREGSRVRDNNLLFKNNICFEREGARAHSSKRGPEREREKENSTKYEIMT